MSYIDNNLLVQEQVLYRTHTHWIIFSSGVGWLILSAILVSLPTMFAFMGIVTFVFMLYDLTISTIRYYTSEFGLTNKRVIVKIGFIRRQAFEMFLQKIEGLQVEQSILGRIFNFGTIIIVGTGGTRDRFSLISNPLEFRKQVQQQIENVLSNSDNVNK